MLDRLLRSNYNTGNSVDLEDEEVISCSNLTFGVLCALCELDKYHRAGIKKEHLLRSNRCQNHVIA